MPVALRELRDEYEKKIVFLVTDPFLFLNGYTDRITKQLQEMGMEYQVYYDVQPDPTLSNAMNGAAAMEKFAPDTIVALSGGSAMDAGRSCCPPVQEYSGGNGTSPLMDRRCTV